MSFCSHKLFYVFLFLWNKGWRYEFKNEILLYSGYMEFCFVLPIMMGCMREEKKELERLFWNALSANGTSFRWISGTSFPDGDSALPSLKKDSMMYYRFAFLKVRGYFCLLSFDSASYLLDKVTAFVTEQRKSKDVYQLYALIYNAGEICLSVLRR